MTSLTETGYREDCLTLYPDTALSPPIVCLRFSDGAGISTTGVLPDGENWRCVGREWSEQAQGAVRARATHYTGRLPPVCRRRGRCLPLYLYFDRSSDRRLCLDCASQRRGQGHGRILLFVILLLCFLGDCADWLRDRLLGSPPATFDGWQGGCGTTTAADGEP